MNKDVSLMIKIKAERCNREDEWTLSLSDLVLIPYYEMWNCQSLNWQSWPNIGSVGRKLNRFNFSCTSISIISVFLSPIRSSRHVPTYILSFLRVKCRQISRMKHHYFLRNILSINYSTSSDQFDGPLPFDDRDLFTSNKAHIWLPKLIAND